jgi:hypothetical protein
MKKSPFRNTLAKLLSLSSLFGGYGLNEERIPTTFSTYKYQDDHDTEYLRRLLK